MQRDNIQLLENQLIKIVEEKFAPKIDLKSCTYFLSFDKNDTHQFDRDCGLESFKLMNSAMSKIMSYNDAFHLLVTENNNIPLWIKIEFLHETNLIVLVLSKRYRKLKIIKEWHQTNPFYPFIIEE